jgi:4-hydroxy-3-polyprenylbenzoate decarboxylase
MRPPEEGQASLPLVVGITGATGAIYGIRALEVLRDTPVETHLVVSEWARRTILAETDWKPDEVRALADHVWEETDGSAPPAGGSFLTRGMIVSPCSMKSLAAIANGISDNLIHRAADVTIKEGRKLVLLVCQPELSLFQMENLARLHDVPQVVVLSPPNEYQTSAEAAEETVANLLDHFGIERGLR